MPQVARHTINDKLSSTCSLLTDMVDQQATSIQRTTQLIGITFVLLFATEIKISKPDDEFFFTPYLRTALKIAGYATLIYTAVHSATHYRRSESLLLSAQSLTHYIKI
jgi:hypothetical protein